MARQKAEDIIPRDPKGKARARVPTYFISRPLKSPPMGKIKKEPKKK